LALIERASWFGSNMSEEKLDHTFTNTNQKKYTRLDSLSRPRNAKEFILDIFRDIKNRLPKNLLYGAIIGVILFLVFGILLPILTERGVDIDSSLFYSVFFFEIVGISFGVYVSIIRGIERYELSRFLLIFLLSIFSLILPFLRIWQLKYGYDLVGSRYFNYTSSDFFYERTKGIPSNLPPEILEAELNSPYTDQVKIPVFSPQSGLSEPIVNPLMKLEFIPYYYKSYHENVKGFELFITIGTFLIVVSAVIAIYCSLRLILKETMGTLLVRDSSGQLVKSQLDLTIYRKTISANRLLRICGGLIILGIIFVFLGVEGIHGLENILREPGVYFTLACGMHMVYLSADPDLRNRLSQSKVAYTFVIPTIVMLLFELYIPILLALFLSFQDIRRSAFSYYDGQYKTNNVGFENYGFIVNNELLWLVTLFVVITLVLIQIYRTLDSENMGAIPKSLLQFAVVAIWFSLMYWIFNYTIIFANQTSSLENYENYIETGKPSIFVSPSPVPVFVNTLIWTLACVTAHMIIGTTLAILMNTSFKGRGVVRSLMIIPWAVPNFITISIFAAFILDNDSGAANMILRELHLKEFSFMSNEPITFSIDLIFKEFSVSISHILYSSILVNIWLGYPFIMVAVLAALQAIPEDLYEAAAIDGATRWQNFRHITYPMIKPTLYVVSLLGFLWTFNLFNVIYLMTIDKQSVLSPDSYYILIVYIFYVFRGQNWSIAATLSFILFVIVAAFSLIYTRLTGKGPYEIGGQ
jgi:ABC-type sugar transport system permease subunit